VGRTRRYTNGFGTSSWGCAMKKRTIGILAASVAVSALCVTTDVSAIAKGGGGGGGAAFHGFAAHGGMSPMGHGWSGHALNAHGWSHAHTPLTRTYLKIVGWLRSAINVE